MTTSSPTYQWLKQLPPNLLQVDNAPLIGYPPSFPWSEFAKKLGELFDVKDLSITPSPAFEWRSEADLWKGLGDKLISLNFTIAPTGGTLYWVMSESEAATLMSLLLSQQPNQMLDADFQQGFYHFIAMEAIHTVAQLDFDKEISATVLADTELPHETALTLDVTIKLHERSLWGRLVISSELRNRWKERFAHRTLEIPLASKLDLSLHLEIGKVRLFPSEWKRLHPGDFLILDRCSLDTEGNGQVIMKINGTSLFRAEVKEGNIEIQEHISYQEEEANMDDEAKDPNEEINENDELMEEDDEENDDSINEDSDADDSDDEVEEGTEEESFVEDEEEEEEDSEIEGLGEPVAQEKWPPPPEKRATSKSVAPETPKPTEADQETQHVDVEKEEEAVGLGKVPFTLVVEMGRLQISLQKLLELQPGNLLEVNIHPENGVDLVVNGKRIGKGELMQVGETLGVRILDIG